MRREQARHDRDLSVALRTKIYSREASLLAEPLFLCYDVKKGKGGKGMKRWLLMILAVFCLLSGCAAAELPPEPAPIPTVSLPVNPYDSQAFAVEEGFLVYEGGTPSLVGVDVSSYQQDIDWPAVAAAGVDFAIIRVGFRGYGTGRVVEDNRFRQNIEGALAAGLEVGVYFFSQAVNRWEAMAEATFVLNRIREYDITFPVVFDWERQDKENSRTLTTSGEVQTDCAVAFCQLIQQAGYLPMVYASPSKAYGELDLSRLTQWPFWLAHYTADLQPTGYRYHYDMWQYSCEGQVEGIPTPVDLNLCLTDFSQRNTQ